jgi:hypothetical protein
MNIPRRIKLLSAAGALSLMSLTGLIAAAPAHARTIAQDRPVSTVSYYTWWIPVVMTPGSGTGCRAGTLTGYSAQFAGDTSVDNVYVYEQLTNGQWQQLEVFNNPSIPVADKLRGTLTPTTVSWGTPAYPNFGTGQYEAWLTDGAGRGGATSFTSCP